MTGASPSWDPQPQLAAAEDLRAALEGLALPLEVRGSADARAQRIALLAQLDDYLLPRLRQPAAPLLAVVGGSTGSGKSTLVNSLIGEALSPSGVLRPTTRAPILLHHPNDEKWFKSQRILPGLSREQDGSSPGHPEALESLQLSPAKSLAPGLALLDSPDIDSIEEGNRDLAQQLLAAADLWVFVTTAARYADAIPWDLLRNAASRGACVAVVLDRVPPKAVKDIRSHLSSMLRDRDLESSPLFTIAEQPLTDMGLLPAAATKPLKTWLRSLAKDEAARETVIRRTLAGAIEAAIDRLTDLSAAAVDQQQAREVLLDAVTGSFDTARLRISSGLTDGRLLRGEVMASWQDFVGSGELLRKVEARIGRWRDRLVQATRARTARTEQMGQALQMGVRSLIVAEIEAAEEQIRQRWDRAQGGAGLLSECADLAQPLADLAQRVDELVIDWQEALQELVKAQGQDRRTAARVLSFGVSGTGVLVMLVTFGLGGGSRNPQQSGLVGGTSGVAQRLLVALFGAQAVQSLTTTAHRELISRVDALLLADRTRFEQALRDLPDGTDHRLLAGIGQSLEPQK